METKILLFFPSEVVDFMILNLAKQKRTWEIGPDSKNLILWAQLPYQTAFLMGQQHNHSYKDSDWMTKWNTHLFD